MRSALNKIGVIFARKKMETDFISELLNFGLFWKVEKLCYRDEEEAIDIYVKFCWERHPLGKGSDGKVKSVEIPSADSHERHSYLFEHAAIDLSRRNPSENTAPSPSGT